MNSISRRSRSFWGTVAVTVCAWAVLATGAIYMRYRDPFGPSVEHPGKGENLPGDVAIVLGWGAIELALLVRWLAPTIRPLRLARAGAVIALYAIWTCFGGLTALHTGTIGLALIMWRGAITAGLLVGWVGFGLAALVRRAAAG